MPDRLLCHELMCSASVTVKCTNSHLHFKEAVGVVVVVAEMCIVCSSIIYSEDPPILCGCLQES